MIEKTARYKRERIKAPAYFDRRSLRIIQRGTHKLIVGCPRGKYDAKAERCTTGTEVQAILHPLSEPNPCVVCQHVKMGWRF